MTTQVIVIGGGLSGLSAAHAALERGAPVLMLDKCSFMGGNSTKATSGINGALTRTQVEKGIPDSAEIFCKDTALSAAGGKPGTEPTMLAKTMAYQSAPAVEWLQEKFGLDLSLLSRLGGHSQPRTHRGKEKFPGMTITYALMEKLEEVAKKTPDRARIIMKARASKLISENGKVVGLEYTKKDGSVHKEHGIVIIATGGYAADFTSSSLLSKYRPDLAHLPTTNGDHCTGDGIKMAIDIGAGLKDMEHIQVHPTGLVHPNDVNSKVKFLAAEALRGVGGIMLTKDGDRFCDELGRRDYVTGEMWKMNKAPYRLCLNSKASKEIEWHCKHYKGRGLMKHFENGAAMAKEMGIPASKLADTFTKYNEAARTKKDVHGKKFFSNMPVSMDEEWNVAIVCPVVHYTMGGLLVNHMAEVLDPKSQPIPGLWCSGEVMGGVHGINRLGGNSLLDCVVYGRIAGEEAASYLLQQLIKYGSSGAGGAPAAGGASKAAAPAGGATAGGLKVYSREEVAKHNTEKDCWCIVNGQVLDCTSFLEDHPGGAKAILLYGGKDATEEFNMLHEKNVVDKYAPEVIIGVVADKSKM
eukprot:Platyproteum_vivax@DN1541_c0_g1_i1.p1